MSSSVIVAPRRSAKAYSSAGVSLLVNMMSSPTMPHFSHSINSVKDEQSIPQPSECKIFMIVGLGVALTAKCSLKPAHHENAS